MIEILGVAAILFGLFFSVVGILGMVRLPDVYTRLHSTGKVSTLGLFGLLVGTALLLPGVAFKLIALAIFAVLTMPVSTHAIAKAAYGHGVPLVRASRDDLAAKSAPSGSQSPEVPLNANP
ncbi:MAG: monovalent cation/H(+) antiporter subunit G [Anaerolineae bacterium]